MKKLSLFAAVIIVAGALIGWTQNSQNVWIRGVLKAGTGQVALTDTTGNLTFSSASGSNKITLTDNQASALDVTESTNSYLKFVTTNSSEGITASKALTCSSTLAVTGASTFGSTVDVTGAVGVTGAATLRSTLAVTGASTFGSTVDVTGAVSATGAATLRSTLAVTGASTFGSTVDVTGAVSATGAATLRSTLAVTGNSTLASNLYLSNVGTIAASGASGNSLSNVVNLVTAGGASLAVVLPTGTTGQTRFVANTSAETVDLYPQPAGSINAGATNAALSMATGKAYMCFASSSTKWLCAGN